MSAAIKSQTPVVTVAKQDLVEAWSVLEKVVVSLRAMGSHYASPGGSHEAEHRREMLEDLNAYFSPALCKELSRARRLLGEYLPTDETTTLSDALDYWEKKPDQRA